MTTAFLHTPIRPFTQEPNVNFFIALLGNPQITWSPIYFIKYRRSITWRSTIFKGQCQGDCKKSSACTSIFIECVRLAFDVGDSLRARNGSYIDSINRLQLKSAFAQLKTAPDDAYHVHSRRVSYILCSRSMYRNRSGSRLTGSVARLIRCFAWSLGQQLKNNSDIRMQSVSPTKRSCGQVSLISRSLIETIYGQYVR